LGIEQIDIADDFFHLGGHSLLATKLVSRIREEFNLALPLRTVFEYPTIAGLAAEIERLAVANDIGNASLDIISVTTERQNLPLSFSQSRLWFLDLLEPNNPAYNIAVAFRLDGALNEEALQRSLQTIIQRHEVLRTTFESQDGVPIQVIHEFNQVPLTITELTNVEKEKQEEHLKNLIREAIISPFNLRSLPLLRVHLYQLAKNIHVFVLVIHHIIADGWSLGLMIKELSLSYTAFCQGEVAKLQPLPIQYADFAHWQRTTFEQTQLPAQLAYWKQKLAGKIEVLELPTDYPRPAIARYQGGTVSFTINREISVAFQRLCEGQGATLFMGLLGVFSTLLMRYSGQKDLLIGTPIANRNRKQIESLIGFFVNTLVIKTDLKGNPDFLELLLRIKEETLQAYAHQDVPFERIVEEIQPERNLSHHPLFQVMFVLQNAPMGKLELPQLQLTPWQIEQVTAKFDLTLLMTETEQGIQGRWEYRTDLFDVATINRMVGHLQTLLECIVANPQQRITELPLLTATEQHQLLVNWNNTQVEYPQDKCLHQLFEVQVEKTPDAIAVVFENQHLTYDELNKRANQLAHYLQYLGVKPEVLIGICVERSIQMVVGLLGILKAGGAYVPLDPTYPQERLSYMLADSGVEVLLTQQSLLESLASHNALMVCLDIDWQAIEQHNQDNLDVGVSSDNLAYVIYTSGSTGVPKGVQICHRSVVNFLNSMSNYPGLIQEDTFNAVTTISFDIAALELYLPLTVGTKLIIASREIVTNADLLLSKLLSSKITAMQATPATWQMLLAAGWSSNYPLKVLCGGEALSPQLAHHILETGSQLWNLYGPTEATIWSTIYQVGADKTVATTEDAPSLIGRPIANTQIYILDSHLQPVPVGVPGELYIGGDGLARGYLNRPELTQEKFIPNPFPNSQSERLYKTGDLARYLASGNIEHLGRIDNQVKIRGFRIELGEIETVLNTHPQIEQAVVIATEDAQANKRLVAYVVSEVKSFSTNQLREFLFSKLPEYMLPAAFVTLDTLPLTPNGKVDRKALPALEVEISREHEYVAPRTAIELQLAQIWSSVINITPVGVRDNFFELGGHSLLAVRLMSQIQQHFQINLPLATLFQNPSIEQLAHILHSSGDSLPWSALVPIKSNGNQSPLFCIHPAGGNVLCYQDLASYLSPEQSFYGLQAFGLNPQNQPHTSIEQMATHYIQELKAVQPHSPYFLSGWSLGGLVAFEMAQQLSHQGEQIALLALLDTYPFSITSQEPEDDTALLVELLGENLDICLEQLRKFEPQEQLIYVLEQAKQKNLVPEDFDLAYACHLLEIYKLNVQAGQIYQPQYYSGSVVLFKASETDADLTSMWNELMEYIEIYEVPGNHQNMVRPTHVKVLAEKLQKSLEQAQTNQLEKSNA
jgi:amino acid adenylation domain-containing protein